MQNGIESSPTWMQIALYLVAPFLAGGGVFKLINIWLNRKKPAAEIHESIARTDKTKAETRRIHVESDVQTATTLARITLRLEKMQGRLDEIAAERDEYKTRVDLQEIELTMRDHDIKRIKGILDSRGIKLSDFDAN